MTKSSSSFDSRFSFFFLSSFIFSSLRLFLFPPRVFVYSNNFCICLSVRDSFSLFFLRLLSLLSSFDFCLPIQSSSLFQSFFALLFFLFVPLALSPFPRLTSGQNRCFEPWTFFSPALLAQLYMPLILFKLQSFPLSFFSISLYTISLTESTPFSFSITSRLARISFRVYFTHLQPKVPEQLMPHSSNYSCGPSTWTFSLSLSLSHSFIHSLTHYHQNLSARAWKLAIRADIRIIDFR